MRVIIGIILAVMISTAVYGYTHIEDVYVKAGYIPDAGMLCPNLWTFNHLYLNSVDDVERNKASALSLGCWFLHNNTHLSIDHNRDVVAPDGWVYYNVCFPGYACSWINALDLVSKP